MGFFSRRRLFWMALGMTAYLGGVNVAPALAAAAPSRLSSGAAISSLREADRIAVERMLENQLVAQRLRDYGVSPQEVQARLAAISDEDLHQLATYSKGLPTGGDAVGALIGVLIVVLLVILILKLLNKEIVVK